MIDQAAATIADCGLLTIPAGHNIHKTRPEEFADAVLGSLVGDIFPQMPKAQDRFVVRAVEPERALVLGDDAGSMSWAFVLEPVDESSTRLITRSRRAYDGLALGLILKVV